MFKWIEKIKIKFREWQYDNYLYNHIRNVRDAFAEMVMNPNLEAIWRDYHIYDNLITRIENHDASKYSKEEYNAYRKYFFPTKKERKEESREIEFQKAWKHHWENNDHHWQYREVNPTTELTEDRVAAIIENICDWLAMGYTFKDRPYQYYNSHKKQIFLSDIERDFLEKIIYALDKDYIDGKRKINKKHTYYV